MTFFFEVLVGGLLSGVMYSLVALGFVLIYRASGVFNFAQGSFVLFGALTFVSLVERGLGSLLAFAVALALLVLVAVLTERLVLRPLAHRPTIVLFMATLGLSYVVEGIAQLAWGAQVHGLDLGIEDTPLEISGALVSKLDLAAAAVAAALVAALSLVFDRTRLGVSLRAIADDPLAAVAVGLPRKALWSVVWGVSGGIALIAGLLWGARVGVQFSLGLIVLKALPVLIIGGFGSVTGTIVAGLLVGASEKVGEVYLGALTGGGVEGWLPYVLALAFLLVRPAGLFGETRIARV